MIISIITACIAICHHISMNARPPLSVSRIDERNIATFKHWRQWEILDKKSGTHLGYMFEDGPRPFGTRC